MSTITKERLKKLIRAIDCGSYDEEEIVGWVNSDEIMELARIALASLEAEPVAYMTYKGYLLHAADPKLAEYSEPTPLYDAPPAPISVPAAMEMDDDFDSAFEHGKAVGWNAYRAAMLQGSDGTLTNEGTITATQFKPVADLYGLTSPTGGETSFTFDAVEARDFIDGGWSCQEYVELERFQEAVSGNSPVIPDGFCIMPKKLTAENGGKGALSGEFHVTNRIVCQSCGGEGCEDCNDEGGLDAEIPVSWDTIKRIHEAAVEACSLPAAPQQGITRDAKGTAMLQDANGNSSVIRNAYDIKTFGIFRATDSENGLILDVERFHFETDSCPQVGKDKFVPKFAIQAIINRLQKHCDNMENDALVDIFASSEVQQQGVKP